MANYQWLAELLRELLQERYQVDLPETTPVPTVPDDDDQDPEPLPQVAITVESGASDHNPGYQWIRIPAVYDVGLVELDGHTLQAETVEGGRYYYLLSDLISEGQVTITGRTSIYTATIIREDLPADPPGGDNRLELQFHGRYNGDRPTWYGYVPAANYAGTIKVEIPGCLTRTIDFNGVRYDQNGLIVKESHVAGRGLTVVNRASCKSTECVIWY